MGNLIAKLGTLLVTFLNVGVSVPTPSIVTSTPTPVVIQSAHAQLKKNISLLADLPGDSLERITAFTKDGNPAPISKNFNDVVGWQREQNISLKEAITKSLASAKDIKKLCISSNDSICNPNPLSILNKDYGFIVQYQDKFLIIWYSKLNEETFYQSQTFIAEFNSLDQINLQANSVYSAERSFLPTGHYADLQLLNLSIFSYRPGYGQECVSSTCSYNELLVKDGTVIGIDAEVRVAMNRYGGGTSCVIIRSQAILLCSSANMNSRNTTKEAFWLK